MEVVVCLEHRFQKTPDGRVWSKNAFAYRIWKRYLQVFDSVAVLARVTDVVQPSPGWVEASGPSVSFVRVPAYRGAIGFVLNGRELKHVIATRIQSSVASAYVARIPSPVGYTLSKQLSKLRIPFGVEVVGDPWDLFAPGAMGHPLRPFVRRYMTRCMRWQCREAQVSSYVTQEKLQRRYPPSPAGYSTFYSSIDLPSDAFVSSPRDYVSSRKPTRLIGIGSLEQNYKGTDMLLHAMKLCHSQGYSWRLIWLGDGRCIDKIRQLASELGIEENVDLVGHVASGFEVRKYLDDADVFVLPSRTEGLPRVLIEAMSRGLPCIATDVGGVSELLPADQLIKKDDAQALAFKLMALLERPESMTEMSAAGLLQAANYHESILNERRVGFLNRLREISEAICRT